MIAEQLRYPFVPGAYGLPLENLSLGVYENIVSGSGRIFSCRLRPDYIQIREPDNTPYLLLADVRKSVLRLNLCTINQAKIHHPDMRATKFVAFAMRHFEKNGILINYFRGEWNNHSDNFKIYQEKLLEGFSKIEAARFTWSGRTMAEYGFTRVEDIDDKSSDFVLASFYRPFPS